jgi:hypothetical protein
VRTARFNRQIWIHMILPISPLLSLQEWAHIMIVPIIIQPSILPFGIPVQPHTLHFHIGRSCPFRSCSGNFYQDRLVGIPLYCKDILELLTSLNDKFGYAKGERGERGLTSLGRRLPSFLRRERESNMSSVCVYRVDRGFLSGPARVMRSILGMYKSTGVQCRPSDMM